MKMVVKGILCAAAAVMCAAAFAGGSKDSSGIPDEITVISRESGSGTRGAFVDLFGVEQKDANGKKADRTAATADISNSTEVVITSVAGNKAAIGYISLGSLNDSVKAVQIDGADATVANIKNGSYKIARPFNVVTKTAGLSETAQDFMTYILSADGQKVIEEKGYISVAKNPAYMAKNLSGKITVGGSSSVFPVMEKLTEAYMKLNPGVTVEVSMSDSGTGVKSAISGVADIGMASRNLKDSETSQGVIGTQIATDGVAVIVNKANPDSNLTKQNVCDIYTGKTAKWSEVQ